MRPLDTSPEMWERQAEIYRRMTPEQRLQIALDLTHMARLTRLDQLRREHPGESERKLLRRLAHELYPEVELPPVA